MTEKLKVAVLISGNGSNLQALIKACERPDYPAEIVLVLSNKEDAYGLKRAKKANIATKVLNHKEFSSREEFDKKMDEEITNSGAEFICMAGFMRLLTKWFTDKWHNKLINIHPSLLPSFKGLNAQQQALDAGVKLAGCTVHFVRSEMDSGPIIIQAAVDVLANDDVQSLTKRILTREHFIYPKALEVIARGFVKVVNEKCV